MALEPRPRGGRPGISAGGDRRAASGFTLLEVLLASAIAIAVMGIAIPLYADVSDEVSTAAAARYIAARIGSARMEALKRGTAVGLRFQSGATDYAFSSYVDGNGNGVRTIDIQRGTDRPLGPLERLGDNFRGAVFALMPDIADVDGIRDGRTEGLRIGTARILTMSPDGTATSGTLYVRGRTAQYAVRVLGATGRTRVLRYQPGDRTWITR